MIRLHLGRRSRLTLALALTLALMSAASGCGKQAQAPATPPPSGDTASAAAPADQAEQPYYVLKPGTVYTYRTASGGETRMEVQEPGELADPAGRKVTGYQLVTDEETIFLTVDQDWVMDVGDSGEGGPMIYKSAKPEFPLHPKAGQSWTKSFADEFEGGSFVSTVTGFETVATPAGTFERAARVEVAFQAPDGSKDHWTEWYAPGVGRVKTSNGLELTRVDWPK